jgi:hypothetical protein
MDMTDSQIQLPKSASLRKLIQEVETALGDKPLMFCPAEEHPSQEKPKWGRYEQREGADIVWIGPGLPQSTFIYVAAHELCHALQKANGFPRVSRRDVLDQMLEKTEGRMPLALISFVRLADKLSNLVLDPGADHLVKRQGFVCKDGLEYMCKFQQEGIQSQCTSFDRDKLAAFVCGLLEWGKRAKPEEYMEYVRENADIDVYTLGQATVYAVFRFRYEPYGLWEHLDKAFVERQPGAKALGEQLFDIACRYELATPAGCRDAAVRVLEHLGISADVFGVKSQSTGKWLWPTEV